jgi:mannitol/fructose-specific phosphotransferase system IIA component (Ntr-type)
MRDMIFTDLKPRNQEDALKAMVEFLKEKNIIHREKDIIERLIQREKLGSTAISEGFAIPHCKIKGIKQPVVLMAISREGVDFNAVDAKPAHIFFLVLSAPENPSLNLQILAAIAHLIRKSKNFKKKIMGADNISAIYDIVRQEEDKIYEQE